jgi:hypothetical protein
MSDKRNARLSALAMTQSVVTRLRATLQAENILGAGIDFDEILSGFEVPGGAVRPSARDR